MAHATEDITDFIFAGKWRSKIICASAELGVFDHLDRVQPRAAGEVAAHLHVDPDLLYRLLRALASLGFLDETENHQFSLTEHGYWLRTDTPGSLRYMALLEGRRRAHGDLESCARDAQGRPAECVRQGIRAQRIRSCAG